MLRLPRQIVLRPNENASAPTDYAAEELTRYLGMLGIAAVRTDACVPEGAPVLRLNDRAPGLPDGAFRRTVTEAGVLLEASEGCGVVYGAYALLEALGFRFLASDCDGIPAAPLPLAFGVFEETPAFHARELFWRDAMDGAFAVRLRLNSARSSITPRQGGKLMFYNFSHSFDALLPASEWFDSHPEYFSMVDGARLRDKTQLCLSNPDVLRLCIAGVRRWIADNPDCRVFSVSMNDWYNPCECPACRAVDAEEDSQAGSVIRFVNAIADDIAKDYPDVLLHTFAYLYCRKPPRLTRPRPNVIVRLCSIECCFAHPIGACGREHGGIDVQNGSARNFADAAPTGAESFVNDLRGWAAICDNLYIWDYTTNYANYLLPFPNLNALQVNLRLFRDCGVKGVFEQGNFSHGQCAALGQLKTYLLGKLLWNPDDDVDALMRDFVAGYYGAAAAPMLRYARLWQSAAGDCHAGIYDMPDAAYLTDALLDEAAACLAEAFRLSAGTPAFERVEREALSVRYARLTREAPETSGHADAVDAFLNDAIRLGVTELFERKALLPSAEALKRRRYAKDRAAVPGITYPI